MNVEVVADSVFCVFLTLQSFIIGVNNVTLQIHILKKYIHATNHTDTMEDKFEMLWLEKRKAILQQNDEYRKATEGYKISSGADLLLFGLPVVAAIVVIDQSFVANEMLNWLLGAGVAGVMFVLAVVVKTLINGSRPVSEIEADVKARCRKQYDETGSF